MSRRAICLRVGLLLVSTACVAALAAGCGADTTSPDALPQGAGPSGGQAPNSDAVGDEGAAPSDDPAAGADTVDPLPEADGGSDAAASPTPQAGTCVSGGVYCGGDKVIGAADTLYKCTGPGTPTVVEKCAAGCMVNSGADDSCNAAPGSHIPAPVPGNVVTYPFGVKNAAYAAGYHTGDDYATATGSDAVAVRSGTIRWSNDNGGAYGKWIGLDADNGRTYVYCHLSDRLVASGAKIVAGQLIAKTGATGNVTGPHLHFEDHPLGPFVYAQVRKPAW